MSQSQVADRLNLNKATISAYERNVSTPSIDTIVRLALLYGASVDFILGLKDRTEFYIDDLSQNQQEFVLNILHQVRNRFDDKK